ncbi:MAG: Fe-S cluster assembly protein SufD [Proteobacteria bacterium]|nr:Fe-S cluster assembly protein SufD [Pseudomonadota bacterium]
MSALLDSLTAGAAGDAVRHAALDAVLRDGLPTRKSEAWKYTSLAALAERAFAPSTAPTPTIDASVLAHIPAPRIAFVNGRHEPALSRTEALPAGVRVLVQAHAAGAAFRAHHHAGADAVFSRLNAALAGSGVLLQAAAGVRMDTPIHLVFLGAPAHGDIAWHLRHTIALEAGAALSVVEHQLAAGAHAHLANTRMQVDLGDGAQLRHLRIQHEAPAASALAHTDATLAGAASYRRLDLELGAGLSRHELNVRLQGDGAHLLANGVLLADGVRHLDTRLRIEHHGRDTACDLLWRGLAGDRGHAVFHGGITIHPGADGSDARLANKNLLLSLDAEIDTQPVLEIHADEVKAAHGATVGQLDEQALFYLRSRGLPQAQARALLIGAFCRQALPAAGDPTLLEMARTALDAALARIGALA